MLAGDLAKKKIYPALFALFYEGMLPKNFSIFGYARSKMSDEEFRNYIAGNLTCRLTDKDRCGDRMQDFLQRCFYQPGQYKDTGDFKKLSGRIEEYEGVSPQLMHSLTSSTHDRALQLYWGSDKNELYTSV